MPVKPEYWSYLLELARAGAIAGRVSMTTTELGNRAGVSQQTASRRLRHMEVAGLVARAGAGGERGQDISLTEAGVAELRRIHAELNTVFSCLPREIVLHGKVSSGIGEGRYYVEKYHEFFERNLDMHPFPGTLNVRLLGDKDVMLRKQIEMQGGVLLRGFSDETRSFGDVFAFHVSLARGEPDSIEVPACFLKIARTHYDESVIEIISSHELRAVLKLADDDFVRIVYMPDNDKNHGP